MNRRSFLTTTATLIGGVALAGCATIGQPVTPASVSGQVKLIANGLAGLPAALASAGTVIPASAVTVLQNAATDVSAVADAIVSVDRPAATSLLVRIEADVNAGLGVLSSVPLPPPAQQIVQALHVLLPFIEATITGIAPQLGAEPGGMSHARAETVLRSARH